MRDALWTALDALLWALVATSAAAQLTVGSGVAAAALGSVLGALVGRLLAGSRLRLGVVWAAGCAGLGVVLLAARLVVWSTVPAALLGSAGAYRLSELLTWLGCSLAVLAVLHASSRRHRAFLALEVVVAGAVLAGVLAAHRDGFINRPYALVDRLWAGGIDPVPVFFALGAAVAALLLLLAALRGSRSRSLVDVALLLLLVLGAFLLLPIGTLSSLAPPPSGGGGKGKETSGGKGTAEQRQAARRAQQGVLESFSDQQGEPGERPVAVVLLHDDYDPPLGYYYLRQTAFSQFNGLRLVQDTTGRADIDVADMFPAGPLTLPQEEREGSLVTSLDTTVALLVQHQRPFAVINPLRLAPTANPDPRRFLRAFRATSAVLVAAPSRIDRLHLGSHRWDRDVWAHYTEGPDDPRYAELAATIVASLPARLQDRPVAQAVAIQLWLGDNGIYSRSSSHEGAPDPLADFLFGDRTGHCVYFAHAACLLMRSRGIPARVGAGYAIDARNRGGGSALLVRERDAHAWPEVYFKGIGWLPLDIAPARSLDPPDPGPDRGLQQMLGEMARGQPPPTQPPPPGRGDLQEALRQAVAWAARGLALLAVVAVLLLYAAKLWRRLAPRWYNADRLPVVAYRAALDRLAEAGHRRGFGETRESFATACAAVTASFAELTRRHLAATLGAGPRPVRREDYLALGERVRRELRQRTPTTRRLLGALDPFSWLRAR